MKRRSRKSKSKTKRNEEEREEDDYRRSPPPSPADDEESNDDDDANSKASDSKGNNKGTTEVEDEDEEQSDEQTSDDSDEEDDKPPAKRQKHKKQTSSGVESLNQSTMSGERNTSSQSVDALLDELLEFCQSDSLSEDGLREIIEQHGVAPNNNHPDICYDFFYEACRNERVTEGILQFLLKYFPYAAKATDDDAKYCGGLPLHFIFENSSVTLGMVQLLIDAFPDSVRHETNYNELPLHCLSNGMIVDEEVAVEILKLLLERCPESVQRTTVEGNLPINFPAATRSPEFCRILVEAYPESVTMTDNEGCLPFHLACGSRNDNIATVKYLYQLYPESINVADDNGCYPIHDAIRSIQWRKSPAAVIELVQFLLDCDPNVALQKVRDKLPLYWVCVWATNVTPKRNAYLKVLHMLYDTHPEAMKRNEVTSNIDRFCEEVQIYINAQRTYARQARDHRVMTTPDENGQLPLHRALRDNETITLGSIKLLVKGNPSAVRCPDNTNMIPLHVACQHHKAASTIEYLIGINKFTLTTVDREWNTVLHYACRGANHAIIALLLDKYGSVSVSKRNMHKQLPIELLLENENEVSNEESVEYTESIYRLLRAYPETIMIST